MAAWSGFQALSQRRTVRLAPASGLTSGSALESSPEVTGTSRLRVSPTTLVMAPKTPGRRWRTNSSLPSSTMWPGRKLLKLSRPVWSTVTLNCQTCTLPPLRTTVACTGGECVITLATTVPLSRDHLNEAVLAVPLRWTSTR